MKLGVVIVNWNSDSQLKKAILSIVEYVKEFSLEIVIVDNASTDRSLNKALLIELPENIRLSTILNSENMGFGYACNQGAMSLKGHYILFMNPDTYLIESIQPLIDFMDDSSNKKIGICGASLIDETGNIQRSCARYLSPFKSFVKTLGINRFYQRFSVGMIEWDHKDSKYVDHVIGAFYLIRRDIFETLNGFDESFFVYYEDIDLSLRANNLGWKSFYFSGVMVFHKGGGTSSQVKAKRLFYSLRSELIYLKKHFGLLRTLIPFLAIILFEPFSRSLVAVFKFSFQELKETFQAYKLLYNWLLNKLRF